MKNHYEVLNLEKNCTAKEIKDSFIKLSKKYHPDLNNSSDAHKRFIEVNEAYSVLGKTCSRIRYDDLLSNSSGGPNVAYQRSATSGMGTSFYETSYSNNFRQNYERSKHWNSTTKSKTLLLCFFLLSVGTGIRLIVLWGGIKKREKLNQEMALTLKEVKERCHRLSKDEQILEMAKELTKNNRKH